MEGIENYWINGEVSFGSLWATIMIATVVLYVALTIIKKRTKLLKASDR
jgi:hypothetical protein